MSSAASLEPPGASAASPPTVDVLSSFGPEHARRLAERSDRLRLLRRPWRVLGRWRSGFPDRSLPWLELLALPVWRIVGTGGSTARGSELSLCALSGQPWAPLPEKPAENTLAASVVPRRWGEEQALARARSLMVAARRRPLEVELRAEPGHRGCWLWIWERRRGRLDVLLLDALHGHRIGGTIRATLLDGGLRPSAGPCGPQHSHSDTRDSMSSTSPRDP